MQLMSIEDLAVYLGDSKRTIYKYIASGDCPPYIRISAKNIKFDRADVDAWLESKKVIPKPTRTRLQARALPWTPRAKRVLKVARQAAGQHKLDSPGAEHLLLAIVEVRECMGAGILRNLGVGKVKVRELYERLCEDAKAEVKSKATGDKSTVTDDVDNVIRCAHEEAVRLGHDYLGAEHLLAGILLVGDGLGHRILTELGVTLDSVRSETAKLVVCRPCGDNNVSDQPGNEE